jgi:tRNA nucleotidyltransferase (CCA-adding enzyme)
MRFPGHVRDAAAIAVAEHGCLLAAGGAAPPESAAEVRRWLSRVGRERVPSVLALWRGDAEAVRPATRSRRERAALDAFVARVRRVERAGPPLAPSELALDGRAVMSILQLSPGPAVGAALRHLLDRVLEDPALNTRARLTSELRAWWATRPSPG